MAILINNKGDISLEIKLVNNDFLDLNSDYGGWIPYPFSFKLLNKEYHFPEKSISPESLRKQDFINKQSSRNSLGSIFKSLNEGF